MDREVEYVIRIFFLGGGNWWLTVKQHDGDNCPIVKAEVMCTIHSF